MPRNRLQDSLFIVLLLSVVSSLASGSELHHAQYIKRIQEEINARFEWRAVNFTETLLANETRLYLHRVLHARNPLRHTHSTSHAWDNSTGGSHHSRLPITIFTSFSISRIQQLHRQCQAWPGETVAALWVPVVVPAHQPQAPAPTPAQPPLNFVARVQQFIGQAKEMLSQTQSNSSWQAPASSAPKPGPHRRLEAGGAAPEIVSAVTLALKSAETSVLDMLAELQLRTTDAITREHLRDPTPGGSGSNMTCDLTVLIFAQLFDSELAASFLYPFNALRNYAALMATTPLVFMVDVDLVPSSQFSQRLVSDHALAHRLVEDALKGNLLIPPAMEAKKCDSEGCPDGVAEGLAAAFGDKALVHTMFKNGSLDTFHCHRGTHFIVDFRRWFNATQKYEIRYAVQSEPWFIGHRSMLPFYDIRFKGFGFDKQIQLAYAAGNMGLRLMVLPDAWLIHLPHSYTPAARLFGAGGKVKVAGPPTASQRSQAPPGSSSKATSNKATAPQQQAAAQRANTSNSNSSSPPVNATRQHSLMQQDTALSDSLEGLLAAGESAHLPEIGDIFGWRPGAGGADDDSGEGGAVPQQHLSKDAAQKLVAAVGWPQNLTEAKRWRSLLGLLTQGGASVPLTTDDPAAAQQVQEFYKHVWHLGAFSFNTCPMPASYSPVLSRDVVGLLHELPWWQVYSYKWATEQPSPADVKVDPPRLPHIPKQGLSEARNRLQDPELEAIRQQRMAQLGGRSGGMPMSEEEQQQQAEAQREAEDQRRTMLAAVMSNEARERLSRIALVKPDKARAIENMILSAAQRGQLHEKVSEQRLVSMLEQISEKQGGAEAGRGPKITIQRRRAFDDDD